MRVCVRMGVGVGGGGGGYYVLYILRCCFHKQG